MSNVRLIGLTTIKIGDITSTKAMASGASLTTITGIVPDSAHLIIEVPGTTDLFIEEADLPDIQLLGTSKKTLEFATRDLGFASLIEAFSGASASTTWSAPVTAMVLREKCLQAVSKVYNEKLLVLNVARASVRTGGDLRFSKTESGQITYSCDVLIPASSTVISPITIKQQAS